jgi:CHAD domain-containing protein
MDGDDIKRPKRKAAASKGALTPGVPPHLAQSSWINYEAQAAISVVESLASELKRLNKKVNADRVHKSRVALRRWFSVWEVMEDDDWQSKKFKKDVAKPLRKLLSMLGNLRDQDVNMELGGKLEVSKELMSNWKSQRKRLKAKICDYVDELDLPDLVAEIPKYLRDRADKVEKSNNNGKVLHESAYVHLDRFVIEHERQVRQMAASATSPEEMHALRLSIKRWRYILTEFFGLTNLELVRAQQLLGQIHDLDRLTPTLSADKSNERALVNLERHRMQLLEEFARMRNDLPYGLRPVLYSTKR